jgi:hypothetical protein
MYCLGFPLCNGLTLGPHDKNMKYIRRYGHDPSIELSHFVDLQLSVGD